MCDGTQVVIAMSESRMQENMRVKGEISNKLGLSGVLYCNANDIVIKIERITIGEQKQINKMLDDRGYRLKKIDEFSDNEQTSVFVRR